MRACVRVRACGYRRLQMSASAHRCSEVWVGPEAQFPCLGWSGDDGAWQWGGQGPFGGHICRCECGGGGARAATLQELRGASQRLACVVCKDGVNWVWDVVSSDEEDESYNDPDLAGFGGSARPRPHLVPPRDTAGQGGREGEGEGPGGGRRGKERQEIVHKKQEIVALSDGGRRRPGAEGDSGMGAAAVEETSDSEEVENLENFEGGCSEGGGGSKGGVGQGLGVLEPRVLEAREKHEHDEPKMNRVRESHRARILRLSKEKKVCKPYAQSPKPQTQSPKPQTLN